MTQQLGRDVAGNANLGTRHGGESASSLLKPWSLLLLCCRGMQQEFASLEARWNRRMTHT